MTDQVAALRRAASRAPFRVRSKRVSRTVFRTSSGALNLFTPVGWLHPSSQAAP